MEIEGRIWRDGKFWLVEMSALDAMTQGRTRKEALCMIADLVFEMVWVYFHEVVELTVVDYGKGRIGISSNDNQLLLALPCGR